MASTTISVRSRLWDEIHSVDWVANVGVPLAVTLLGLTLAVLAVAAQLRHDRNLRRADRVSESARTLGRACVTAAWTMRDHVASDVEWQEDEWPAYQPLIEAIDQAELAFGSEPLEEVREVASDVLAVWQACVGRRHQLSAAASPVGDESAYMDATYNVLFRWWSILEAYGTALLSWDGLGKMPQVDRGSLLGLPQDGPQASAWLGGYASRFEQHVKVGHAP